MLRFLSREKQALCRRFAERFYALGAQRLLHEATVLHHRNLLEVGLERAVGGTQGERAVVTESGCLAAVIALCHV